MIFECEWNIRSFIGENGDTLSGISACRIFGYGKSEAEICVMGICVVSRLGKVSKELWTMSGKFILRF